jgi:hypothetical protein
LGDVNLGHVGVHRYEGYRVSVNRRLQGCKIRRVQAEILMRNQRILARFDSLESSLPGRGQPVLRIWDSEPRLAALTLGGYPNVVERFSAYLACLRSPVRKSAPISTNSAKSRVAVAGEAPVIVA